MATASIDNPAKLSPVYLIAGLYSAHLSGDRELERVQRDRLRDDYGIRVKFDQPQRASRESGRAPING